MEYPVYVFDAGSPWQKHETVYGLGDRFRDALILNQSLHDWHAAQPLPTTTIHGPCFLVAPDLWVSKRMWQRFAEISIHQKSVVQLARHPNGPGRLADPLSRLPRDENGSILFDLYFVPEKTHIDPGVPFSQITKSTMDVDAPHRKLLLPVDPHLGEGGFIELLWTDAVCAPIAHWSELLRTNLLALGAEAMGRNPARKLLRLLWAALQAFSFRMENVLPKMNTIGSGCQIHKTAVVENCVLGDFVEVGPGAVVRGCHIGNDVRIESQAICELSVIAGHANIQRRAMVNASLVYPKARIGGILQFAIAGRESTSKMFAVGTDMRLLGKVRVETVLGLREVDLGYQGVCFGHHSFVGSGVWIAPGRVIPAHASLVRSRDDMVMDPAQASLSETPP